MKNIDIINFSDCAYSNRHGRYGGNAGDKDGIIYNNENWIIKYPKNTKSMMGDNLPHYTSAPLSEYIGSHIYEILGYDVHETLLGIRQNKLVVACKDFQKHFGDLGEIRTLKNAAHEQMEGLTDDEIPISATGDKVNLNELFFHLENNPLMQLPSLKERFYDQIIIDIFINNNDRNNGNWGILYEEDGNKLAPVFDNGNAFNNKTDDLGIIKIMALSENDRINRVIGERTAYSINDKVLSAKKILNFDNDDIKKALIRNVPLIKENMNNIKEMINNIPEEFQGISICSKERKEFYLFSLNTRLEKLLEPAYEKAVEQLRAPYTVEYYSINDSGNTSFKEFNSFMDAKNFIDNLDDNNFNAYMYEGTHTENPEQEVDDIELGDE